MGVDSADAPHGACAPSQPPGCLLLLLHKPLSSPTCLSLHPHQPWHRCKAAPSTPFSSPQGEGFAWGRCGKVKSTALPRQLRGQKGPCATTETLGARPGIYTVICIRALTRKSFQHCSLGGNISFLTNPALTSARESGLRKGIVR